MKRFIDVRGDEVVASCGEAVLKSEAKNACLVIAAYDAVHKVGALAHAMLLSDLLEKRVEASALHNASKAIDEMIEEMTLLGAGRDDIEIRLMAGENVPFGQNDSLCNRNLSSALEILKQRQVRFKDSSIQDVGKAHVSLDVESGSISYA